MGFWEVAFIALVSAVFVAIVFCANRYRRCPSDKILVIYGRVSGNRSAKCLHGGGSLVLPMVQDYAYLSLTPMTISIPLQNALSLQNIRINVPSTFTVGISTDEKIMNNAAERLLNLSASDMEDMAKEIIFGQLRLTVASLTIEQINQDRESFLESVRRNVEPELNKIGLYLINVNITDITDASNYIESIGKKAASEAIESAKIDVAEQVKRGAIGESVANKEKTIEVAKNTAEAEKGQKDAEADRRIFVQKKEAEAVIGEAEANSRKMVEVSKMNADAEIGKADADSRKMVEISKMSAESEICKADADSRKSIEISKRQAEAEKGKKDAETDRRVYIQQKESEAIEGENKSKAAIVVSNSQFLIAEAEAKKNAEVALRQSQTEINKAQYFAELERLNSEQIVLKEIEKKKIELEAQARALRISTEAQGEADALLKKYQAEAEGIQKVLSAKAAGYAELIKSVNGDAKALSTLLMVEKLETIVGKQVDAIKNLKIDKITVWDSGDANNSSTSNFISNFAKALPPLQDIAGMAGVELPSYLGHVKDQEKVEKDDVAEKSVATVNSKK